MMSPHGRPTARPNAASYGLSRTKFRVMAFIVARLSLIAVLSSRAATGAGKGMVPRIVQLDSVGFRICFGGSVYPADSGMQRRKRNCDCIMKLWRTPLTIYISRPSPMLMVTADSICNRESRCRLQHKWRIVRVNLAKSLRTKVRSIFGHTQEDRSGTCSTWLEKDKYLTFAALRADATRERLLMLSRLWFCTS